MTKASTAPITKPSDEALAGAYRDLESPIADVHTMCCIFDEVMDGIQRSRKKQGEGYVTLLLTLDQETALVGAWARLYSEAGVLCKNFYSQYGEAA